MPPNIMNRARTTRVRTATILALSAGVACSLSVPGTAAAVPSSAAPVVQLAAPGGSGEIAPGVPAVDPQKVANLDDLTWNDFKPVPNTNWADPNVQPTVKRWKAVIVLVDYVDVPFQVTQPQGSNVWGNPGPAAHDIPREQVPQFYADFLNKPSALNNQHTINEYWMEDTGGRYGVEVVAYGPYRMPKKSYQYFYSSYGNKGPEETRCPAVLQCNGNFRSDAAALWAADTGKANPATDFDNVFYLGAGADQSASWLEFGKMMFKTPQEIPDKFGPPQEWKDAVKAATGKDAPNWASTRYVDWSAWAASASMWPNASGNTSIEAESSGRATYAHEFSHNLSIGDNYGNPYANPALRDQSGAWDMMSRGSFNGPGGPHARWNVPIVLGDQMGSQHMLRDKMFLNTVPSTSVVNVSRSDLKANGVAVTNVTAREVQLAGQKVGVNVVMDGGDASTCASQGASGDKLWMCDFNRTTATDESKGNYNNYTMEVVDRMGSDSFTADSGVLLAKTKNSGSPNKWVIDANPQDIDQIDYYMADGTPVKLTRGDHRQLNDALFKAGSGSGSQFEYDDPANKLHFYVLDTQRDAAGVLSYQVAVRSTDASGALTRGVTLANPAVAGKTPGKVASCLANLTNTGGTAENPLYSSDVYRLSASVEGVGWSAVLPQQVVAAAAGGSRSVAAYAVRGANAAESAKLTLTATSESDSSKSASVSCTVSAADTATPGSGVQVITASVAGHPLTLVVPSNAPVVLNPVALTGVDQVTSGSLNPVSVVDSRGTAAGWDLTGQSSDFSSEAGRILADNLGWRPAASKYVGSLPTDDDSASAVSAGPVVVPGSGLGTAKTLCKAEVGHSAGSFTCSGGLDLGVPGASRAGTYSAVLTLTLI